MDQVEEVHGQTVTPNDVIIFLGSLYAISYVVISTFVKDLNGQACSSFCKGNKDKTRANGMKRHAMYSTQQQLY